MAHYKKTIRDGIEYYCFVKTVGKKLNSVGNEIPIKKKFYGKTKKELEYKIQEYMDQKAQGIEDNKQYFGIMAENWIEHFFAFDGSIADSTKSMYVRYWKKFIKPSELYHLPLNEVSASRIQKLYNSLHQKGNKESSIGKVHKLMRKFYAYIEVENYGRDVTGSLRVPKDNSYKDEETSIVVWTEQELKTILARFNDSQRGFRLRFFIVLAIFTGCRFGELLGLKYEDFDEEGVHIKRQLQEEYTYNREGKDENRPKIAPPKSKSSVRTIPLNEYVAAELELHRSWHEKEQQARRYKTDFVFTTNSGEFYDKKNVSRALARYYDRIGVEEKSVHIYRHTFGTNLCRMGVDIQTASKLLGHSDINTTAKYYVGISQEQKQLAVNKLLKIVAK